MHIVISLAIFIVRIQHSLFFEALQVAESLLQWLRALPGPLIPCRLFRAFLQTQNASCQAERLSELHLLFQQVISSENMGSI